MTSVSPVQCLACARLDHSDLVKPLAPNDHRVRVDRCEAFPDGIPISIALAGADHRNAFGGDHGLRFLQLLTPEAKAAFADWQSTYDRY
jgi:hypothetical protein